MAQIDVPGTDKDDKEKGNDSPTVDDVKGQAGKDEKEGPNNEGSFTE